MPKTYNSLTVGNAAAGSAILASDHAKAFENINNYRVPPMCRALRTSSQSIPNNTTEPIQFDAADVFDTDDIHSPTVNNTRFTISTAGVYLITGWVYYASNATGTYRMAGIRKNGTLLITTNGRTGTADNRVNVTIADAAAAGDYYEITAYQDSGGSLGLSSEGTTYATGSVVWLGQVS